MSLSSGTRLGPYEILTAAGSGRMGEVYRARDTRLDRVIAVTYVECHTGLGFKVCDPKDQALYSSARRQIALWEREEGAFDHLHVGFSRRAALAVTHVSVPEDQSR